MNRRAFLRTAGAFAGLEIEPSGTVVETPETVDREDGGPPAAGGAGVAPIVRVLPTPGGSAGDGYALSATRLGGTAATATEETVAEAAAYGTVLAGRVATDVAFGLRDGSAFGDRLLARGHDPLETRDGWTLLGRRRRTRYRLAAVAEETAIVGTGPVRAAVERRVDEAMAALDRAGRDAGERTATDRNGASRNAASRNGANRNAGHRDDRATRAAMVDRLGGGTHLYLDTAPDPRRAGEAAVAAGERYDIRGDATAVRDVVLFESPADARDADADDSGTVRVVADRAGADVSVRHRGRAVVRDATVPTDRLRTRP